METWWCIAHLICQKYFELKVPFVLDDWSDDTLYQNLSQRICRNDFNLHTCGLIHLGLQSSQQCVSIISILSYDFAINRSIGPLGIILLHAIALCLWFVLTSLFGQLMTNVITSPICHNLKPNHAYIAECSFRTFLMNLLLLSRSVR